MLCALFQGYLSTCTLCTDQSEAGQLYAAQNPEYAERRRNKRGSRVQYRFGRLTESKPVFEIGIPQTGPFKGIRVTYSNARKLTSTKSMRTKYPPQTAGNTPRATAIGTVTMADVVPAGYLS